MNKINTGKLWIGKNWKEAIKLSLETLGCGVEEIYKDKYLNNLLDVEKIFIGYQIFGWGNRRKYKTRIPKSLNQFVKNLLEDKENKNANNN